MSILWTKAVQVRYTWGNYTDSMDMMYKGVDTEFPLIFLAYKAIDFSGNEFTGRIPKSVGLLKALIHVNFSRNAFTCSISHHPRQIYQIQRHQIFLTISFLVISLVILPNSHSCHTWTSPTTFSKVLFQEALSFKGNIVLHSRTILNSMVLRKFVDRSMFLILHRGIHIHPKSQKKR